MVSIEKRLRQFTDKNLEADVQPTGKLLDPGKGLADSGVSSLDRTAFGKMAAREFNISLTPVGVTGI